MTKRRPLPNSAKHALEAVYEYLEMIDQQVSGLLVSENEPTPSRSAILSRAAAASRCALLAQQCIAEVHPDAPAANPMVKI